MTDAKEPEGIDEPRVITALHLLRDLGFTALYDAEERPAADISDILNAWAALTKRAEAAEAEAEAWELSSTNWQADCRVAQCERDALRKDAALLREFVSSDGIAMTYQTMGQYRAALLALRAAALVVQP